MSEVLKFHQWKYEQQNQPQFRLIDPSFEHVIRIKDEAVFHLHDCVIFGGIYWAIAYFYTDLKRIELSYRVNEEELLTRIVEINDIFYLP